MSRQMTLREPIPVTVDGKTERLAHNLVVDSDPVGQTGTWTHITVRSALFPKPAGNGHTWHRVKKLHTRVRSENIIADRLIPKEER